MQVELVKRYLHSDLLNKDHADSVQARYLLGIGLLETQSINKRLQLTRPQGGSTHIKTFYEYIAWYRSVCNLNGSESANLKL